MNADQFYQIVCDNYMLSKPRLKVFGGLLQFGPCTTDELNVFMQYGCAIKIGAKLAELMDLGFVQEMHKRECHISKKVTRVWMFTNKVPERNSRGTKATLKQRITFYKNRLKKAERDLSDYVGYING